MSWNHRIRQIHRSVSVIFTALVVANIVVMVRTGGQREPDFLTYSPLLPLALLLLTGLYLFVLPYVTRWRARRRTGTEPS